MSKNSFHFKSGSGTPIVFLHGWGMNSHLFKFVKTDCPTLLCDIGNPLSLCEDLRAFIEKKKLGPVHLVGFSMGACLSVSFVKQFTDLVASTTLLALGVRYERPVLDDIRSHVTQNAPAYLRSFYKACFSDAEDFTSFYSSVGKDISTTVTLESLLNGLDYLATVSITADDIPESNCVLFHGEQDFIAPLRPLLKFELQDSDQLQTLPNSGHYILDSKLVTDHLARLA